MRITVSRIDAHRYATTVERGDGVTLRVPGYGFMRELPHDLAHFVVEATLRRTGGFWGSIASGAMLHGMAVLGGRQRPHAAEKGKAIAKHNAPTLGEAECLVAAFETIIAGGLDRQWPRAEACLRERLASRPKADIPGHNDVAVVCAAWRELQSSWNKVLTGGSLHLDWPSLRARLPTRAGQG